MLSRLKISNFALVEDIELTIEKGMTVLTGETGAGKSVIVTALGLVLGDRADREHIRHGTTLATVEATFAVDRLGKTYRDRFAEFINDNGFTVTRELRKDGSSRVRLNGRTTTVAKLKELTSPLAEILGQHANQLLLDESNHLLFLDRFAALDNDREETAELYAAWEKAHNHLKKTKARRDQLAKERELLLFQQNEIDQAQVRAGEEDELTTERRILDSSRTLIESSALLQEIFDGEGHSILDNLRAARKEIDKVAAIDPALQPQVEQVADIEFRLEDLRAYLEQYGSSIPDDPKRLEEINLRLDEIYNLKQKYGGSEEAVLQTLEEIQQKLKDRPDIDVQITALEKDAQSKRKGYTEKALSLSEVRKKAAKYLQKLTVKELKELAIDKARFECDFVYEERSGGVEIDGRSVKPYPHGLENVYFRFSANPGEPLKSLVKTASGGEISRVLLALKAAEKKNNNLAHSLLVFDEVDAGIGGQTGIEVGKKIKRLAESAQVLVITHLHQIARLADQHLLATKTTAKGKRITIAVEPLDDEGVATELNRMVALPED